MKNIFRGLFWTFFKKRSALLIKKDNKECSFNFCSNDYIFFITIFEKRIKLIFKNNEMSLKLNY